MEWTEFSALSLPPMGKFVLVYVEFDGPTNPKAAPQILKAWCDKYDGHWRTSFGKLKGRVTHWMRLPEPPTIRDKEQGR